MTNRQEIRQRLAELIDEHDRRKAAVADAECKRQGAVQRLSQLRAKQELDKLDLSDRAQQCEKEIADADAVIGIWPDIQAELAQRMADAQQALKAAESAELLAELAAIRDAEPVDRQSFASALHLLALVGRDLNQRLARKFALKGQLAQMGVAVADLGDFEMLQFNRWGIGQQSAVDEAQALIQRYQ